MRHFGLPIIFFLLLASQLFWLRAVRLRVQRFFAPPARRRAVVVAVGVVYLILFTLHFLWPAEMEFFLIASLLVVILFASQFFWLRQIGALAAKFIPDPARRLHLGLAAVAAYFLLFFLSLGAERFGGEPTRLTLKAALVGAPFPWWFVSSLLGFFLASLVFLVGWVIGGGLWAWRKLSSSPARAAGAPPAPARGTAIASPAPAGSGYALAVAMSSPSLVSAADDAPDLPSPGRRHFLERTAAAIGSVGFLEGAYGLLYGRVDLETTHQRIKLPRLPKAFDGFRIAQLSDIHIGPFMTAAEIRTWVDVANRLRPDLVALTGDFVTWDPDTQGAAVEVLSGLRAPFGVFGCLGNHELWTETEDSITRLFTLRGIRILRGEGVLIETRGETLNLLGVDYRSLRGTHGPGGRFVRRYLESIEHLVRSDTTNILMSHNPNTFDRAAELGIDLSLAGHTHGGQVTLEYISPNLCPSRLITRYVKGWFRKPGGQQLYVNRGLGTIGVPMRLGAPPEITLYELVGV